MNIDFNLELPGFSVIVAVVLAALAGMLAARKIMGPSWLQNHQTAAGLMLSVSGTLYAVLLGMLVVDAMEVFQDTRTHVEQEANQLADVYLMAEQFGPQKNSQLRKLARSYAQEVIEREWPMMAERRLDRNARMILIDLIRATEEIEPKNERETAIYSVIVQKVYDLRDSRRLRTSAAANQTPAIEWLVLSVGALITMGFTFFVAPQSRRTHGVMTLMAALMIGLNLYLLVQFASPFAGDISVDPSAFKTDLELFDQVDGKIPPD